MIWSRANDQMADAEDNLLGVWKNGARDETALRLYGNTTLEFDGVASTV